MAALASSYVAIGRSPAGTRLNAPQRHRQPLQSRARVCVASAAEAEGPSSRQKIRVKLASYHAELLKESVDLIRTATEDTGATVVFATVVFARGPSWCVI